MTIDAIDDFPYADLSQVTFLVGSGASIEKPTCIPTVASFLKTLLSGLSDDAALVEELSRWTPRAYRFEGLLEELAKCSGDRGLEICGAIGSSSYNTIHDFLAFALTAGSIVITTNFDNCIENALEARGVSLTHSERRVFAGEDWPTSEDSCLYKPHGSNPFAEDPSRPLVATVSALAQTASGFRRFPNVRRSMLKALNGRILFVVGYSGSDDFDMTPVLRASRPKEVYWLDYSGDEDRICFKEGTPIGVFGDCICTSIECVPRVVFSEWGDRLGERLRFGPDAADEPKAYLKQYLEKFANNDEGKLALMNTIALCQGKNEMVRPGESYRVRILYSKALYRQGDYDSAISLLLPLSRSLPPQTKERCEAMYYLSSAYYQLRDYYEAERTGRLLVDSARGTDEPMHLNAMINLAGILLVMGSESGREEFIGESRELYETCLARSCGVSIEVEANANWGLAELEKLNGNIDEARCLYGKALVVLQEIGNSFAVDMLLGLIRELDRKR